MKDDINHMLIVFFIIYSYTYNAIVQSSIHTFLPSHPGCISRTKALSLVSVGKNWSQPSVHQ